MKPASSWIGLPLALIGCNALEGLREPPIFATVSAGVRGDSAYVYVDNVESGTELAFRGQNKTVKQEKDGSASAIFYLALDVLKPGRNELEVTLRQDGKEAKYKDEITVPRLSGEPFFQIHSCVLDDHTNPTESGFKSVKLTSSFGHIQSCVSRDSVRFRVNATATPGAKVTVANKEIELGDDGEMVLDLSVVDALLGAVVGGPARRHDRDSLPIVVRVEHDGKTLERAIRVAADPDRVLHDWASAFEPGKPLHSHPAADGQGMVMYISKKDKSKTRFAGGPGPVRNVRALAMVESYGPQRDAGSCGPYVGDFTGSAPVQVQDAKVTLYAVHTGEKLAEKNFAGKRGRCPAAISAINGKVRTLSYGPSPKEIDAWALPLAQK